MGAIAQVVLPSFHDISILLNNYLDVRDVRSLNSRAMRYKDKQNVRQQPLQ